MELIKIHERLSHIEDFKEKNKVAKEALKSELENNDEYMAAQEEMKTLSERLKRLKGEIWAQAETQKLAADIKDNKEELDTLEEILSTELMEYYKENETTEIEDVDGEKRQFKLVAKLLPKKKKYEDRDADGRYASKIDPEVAPGI